MKTWDQLQKGDKLYLLIPYWNDERNILMYEYQDSEVINVHNYDNVVNIRLKYTSRHTGKRLRINLCINKLKYNQKYVSTNKETGYARDYHIKYGDCVVTFYNPEILHQVYLKLINEHIKIKEDLIKEQQDSIKQLIRLKNEI